MNTNAIITCSVLLGFIIGSVGMATYQSAIALNTWEHGAVQVYEGKAKCEVALKTYVCKRFSELEATEK
ncbi:hypothetical protein VPHD239_0052 [Vibrio phage D239]